MDSRFAAFAGIAPEGADALCERLRWAAPAPPERPSAQALDAVLADHRVWMESAGRQGHRADLRTATGLVDDQLANASGDQNTRLPDLREG